MELGIFRPKKCQLFPLILSDVCAQKKGRGSKKRKTDYLFFPTTPTTSLFSSKEKPLEDSQKNLKRLLCLTLQSGKIRYAVGKNPRIKWLKVWDLIETRRLCINFFSCQYLLGYCDLTRSKNFPILPQKWLAARKRRGNGPKEETCDLRIPLFGSKQWKKNIFFLLQQRPFLPQDIPGWFSSFSTPYGTGKEKKK